MARHLFSWIGQADLNAANPDLAIGMGPIGQVVASRKYDGIWLLSNYGEDRVSQYEGWLRERYPNASIEITRVSLSSPTNFAEIYTEARGVVRRVVEKDDATKLLSFHLSPGTPAMAAVWIILGKTRFPAEMLQSSVERGVEVADVPFDISADFIPDLLREKDSRLRELSAASSPDSPEFSDFITRSPAMNRLVRRAQRVALRNVPVLIEGESGTGKEMLARSIHRASPRSEKDFIAVNCGAIPMELVESELFGHEKGAFTGASQAKKGYFEAAHGGTLFLDEIGELPPQTQVKLLRALQENEVVRVGATKPIKVDVRIIAATNRTLVDEIASGQFREDLFYRLAVAVLTIPALQDRQEDIGPLIDRLFEIVNEEASSEPGHQEKKLSVSARTLLIGRSWRGNVRELQNTLRRAVIWSAGSTITKEDIADAFLPITPGAETGVLNRPLGNGLDLQQLLGEVACHYLERAIVESGGNKTRAAELVGLPSYQTLTNWLKKYGVES